MRVDARSVDGLRLIRLLTQYIAPGLVAVVMLGELLGASLTGPSLTGSTGVYNYLLVAAFTVLTVTMIAICGWTVFVWDIGNSAALIRRSTSCWKRAQHDAPFAIDQLLFGQPQPPLAVPLTI